MLYKYLSAERIDVIETLSVRFSPVLSLNDPFESLPLVDIGERMIDELERAYAAIDAFWENSNEKTDEKRKEMDEAKATLAEHADVHGSPEAAGAELVKSLGDNFGILSLSRTKNSLLMWSHYAENGRGYVIAFDDKHEFFRETDPEGRPTRPIPVVYSSDRTVASLGNYSACRRDLNAGQGAVVGV